MKITRLETFTVVVPLHPGAWHSVDIDHAGDSWEHGHWPERSLVLLRLHTDDGLTGLGEVARGVTAREVEEAVGSLIGRELFSINLQSLSLEMAWFAPDALPEIDDFVRLRIETAPKNDPVAWFVQPGAEQPGLGFQPATPSIPAPDSSRPAPGRLA